VLYEKLSSSLNGAILAGFEKMTQSLVTTLTCTLGKQPVPPPPDQNQVCSEPTGPLGGGQCSQSIVLPNHLQVHPQIVPPMTAQDNRAHSAIPALSGQSGSESKMSAQKSLGFDECIVNHSKEGMFT
jgi:hypothetical protein